jgi:uncharacterized protein YjbK
MAALSREIEFKFAVNNKQAFLQLLKHLNLSSSLLDHGVTQTNHFFDSQTLCLHKNHFVIRLREEGENRILTIKGEQQTETGGKGVLTDRVEQEVVLPHETALGLLRGNITARQVIKQHFGDRSSAILQMIASACNDNELVHIGEFENIRVHLPPVDLTVGDTSAAVEFELDTSTFPDGNIDHEFEVEIAENSDAENIQAALIKLFQQASIDWDSAPSKAERFFSALSR